MIVNEQNSAKKCKIELSFIAILCVSAVLVEVLSFSTSLRPNCETLALWFQRSGAITSIFSAFAQYRIGNFGESIRGGMFNESWWLYRLFNTHHYVMSWIIAAITVWGSFVWGYGDLLIKYIER